MSNYLYSSNAVDSLIAYINDVKPFHSKLSEIVEEYQFYETVNVKINDDKRFTRTKIAGIWDSEIYSDGLYAPYLNLPFVKQAKSSKYWNGGLGINFTEYDKQIPGLTTAYPLGSNTGVRHVKKNGATQTEGIDFHLTHGAYTVTLDGQKQKYVESMLDVSPLSDSLVNTLQSEQDAALENTVDPLNIDPNPIVWESGFNPAQTVGLQLLNEDSRLGYDDVTDGIGSVIKITPNLDAPNYEEWTLECVKVNNTSDGTRLSFDYSTGEAALSQWQIQHALGTKDVFIQCYAEVKGVTVPISPKRIEFTDDNTINVYFTKGMKGFAKVIRYVRSSLTYAEDFPVNSAVWDVQHNLGTTSLIFSTMVFLNGTSNPIEKLNPKRIEFVNDNRVRVYFTNPQAGRIVIGAAGAYTSNVFEQPVASKQWSFANTLNLTNGVFQFIRADGSIIFPKDVIIDESFINVTFSRPTAGKMVFTKLFATGNENTIFSVSGSETGLIGFAKVGLTFSSSLISFIITAVDSSAHFYLGQKFVLTPHNRIVSHKNYTAKEKWSFIKVNPIAHKKPRFSKTNGMHIIDFSFSDPGVRPQNLTATFNGSTFDVVSSLDGSIGTADIGSTFSTSEYSFKIVAGYINPSVGDYFYVTIENDDPYAVGFDLTLGYDVDITAQSKVHSYSQFLSKNLARPDVTAKYPTGEVVSYDVVEYDDRLIGFDLSVLNLTITNKRIQNCYFELEYNGTYFTVKKFTDSVNRIPLAEFAYIYPGVPYTCVDFSINLPSNVEFFGNDSGGDLFVFSVINPDPAVDAFDFSIVSLNFGHISLYPKSFIDSPAKDWLIRFTDSTNFEVFDQHNAATKWNGNVYESFDNGYIHFTIFTDSVPFEQNDLFRVTINDEKPSYLVHNEVTGFSKPLTVGKWYWNGKIGLKIDFPKYVVPHTQQMIFTDHDNPLHQWIKEVEVPRVVKVNEEIPVIKLDSGGSPIATIKFTKPPRYDSASDTYDLNLLDLHKTVNNVDVIEQRFDVFSSHFGHQRGAGVGQTYYDDMKHGLSRDVPGHHDGTVEFIINASSQIPQRTSGATVVYPTLHFEVRSNDLPLHHANDLIIFNNVEATDDVYLERATYDRLYLKSSSEKAEIAFNPYNEADHWFPIYTKPAKIFSDESDLIDVHVAINDKKIGTITRTIGAINEYQLRVDGTDGGFFSEYLPFNTRLASKVVQDEQENEFINARITEKMKFFDLYRFSDKVNISLLESKIKTIVQIPVFDYDKDGNIIGIIGFHDRLNVKIFDSNFKGFFSGYDTQPYDFEVVHPNEPIHPADESHTVDSYYEDSGVIQTAHFGVVAGGAPVNPNTGAVEGYGGVGMYLRDNSPETQTRSKISEIMVIYSRLSADAIGYAPAFADSGLPPLDAEGWNNADVYDGLPLVDPYGWDNAVFDMQYGLIETIETNVTFDLTAYVGSVKKHVDDNGVPDGSELSTTPYASVPSALIAVTRTIETATIMLTGLSVNNIVMYSDLQAGIQIPINVVEQTADFIKIQLTTPSVGKIVIF